MRRRGYLAAQPSNRKSRSITAATGGGSSSVPAAAYHVISATGSIDLDHAAPHRWPQAARNELSQSRPPSSWSALATPTSARFVEINRVVDRTHKHTPVGALCGRRRDRPRWRHACNPMTLESD
uniref:Uncharacterized protein n=1 Tax=Plectus sambesii TaxID=2011161 RepID=A0A914VJK6_9BILA